MPGTIVETEYGEGKTKNEDNPIGGKILVYFDNGTNRLMMIEKIKIIGYYE